MKTTIPRREWIRDKLKLPKWMFFVVGMPLAEPVSEAITPFAPPQNATSKSTFRERITPFEGSHRQRHRIAVVSLFIWITCLILAYFGWSLASAYQYRADLGGITIKEYITSFPQTPSINCDSATAPTKVQTYFMIDIFAFTNLQFWQVKLIDVALDIVIGQLGRFIHGWILYRYVVAAGVSLVLESSGLPYSALLNLSFSTVSIFAIWDTIKSIWAQRNPRATAIQLWLVFAIAFTLSYPLLWSTATGYINPSKGVYEVPDGTLQFPLSDSITLCFSLDTERLGTNVSQVVLGPSLKSLADQAAQIKAAQLVNATQFSSSVNMSAGFSDILKYSLTQQMVQYAINQAWVSNTTVLNYSTAGRHISQIQDEGKLPLNLFGSQLCGQDEPGCSVTAAEYPSGVLPQFSSRSKELQQARGVYYPNFPSYWASNIGYPAIGDAPGAYEIYPAGIDLNLSVKTVSMVLNGGLNNTNAPAIDISDPGTWTKGYSYGNVIYETPAGPHGGKYTTFPYNSSLWLDGKLHELPAPFLDYNKGCPATVDWIPACLCYNGEPITYFFPSPGENSDMMGCLSDSNAYAWGIATVLTSAILCLEVFWILGCWSVWLDAEKRSVLWKYRRSRFGMARNVLDIAAAINHDLGMNTAAEANGDLRKELDKLDMVGHELDGKLGDVHRVGILTRRHGRHGKKAKTAADEESSLGKCESGMDNDG